MKKVKIVSLLVILVGGMQAPMLSGVKKIPLEKTFFDKYFKECVLGGCAILVAAIALWPLWPHREYPKTLRSAVIRDDLGAVKDCIENGEKVSKEEISIALLRGNLNIFKFLIKGSNFGVDVKLSCCEETPLQLAAERDYLEIVKYLVENKAVIDSRNHMNRTPLYYAAQNENFDVVKYLIINGADINAVDELGRTPLLGILFEISCSRNPLKITSNQLRIIKFLVEHGADIKATSTGGDTPLSLAKNAVLKLYLTMVADLYELTNKKNNNDKEIDTFVQKYLSTQDLINKNFTDVIGAFRGSFATFEEIFNKARFKNSSLKVEGFELKNVGTNHWYLMLLRIATSANNLKLAQNIIAKKIDLWGIVDNIFVKKYSPSLFDFFVIDKKKQEILKLKKALSETDKDLFLIPFRSFMCKKMVLDQNKQKEASKWPIPSEVTSHILGYCAQDEFKKKR